MKVMIIGYGKMGKIHEKYLMMTDTNYITDDITYPEHPSINDVTHVIICTPIDTHYNVWRNLRSKGFDGPILCEKPACTKRSEFDMLLDPLLSVGLCERYNTEVNRVKNEIDKIGDKAVSLRYTSMTPIKKDIYTEIFIHGVDLMTFFNIQTESIKFYNINSNRHQLNVNNSVFEVWHNSLVSYRKMSVSTKKGYIHSFDLLKNKCSPILLEQLAFFNGIYHTGLEAHEVLFGDC